MPTLSPKVDATLKAGLALAFDGLSEVTAEELPQVIEDIKFQLDNFHPGQPASFQQWLTDSNAAILAIAADTNNVTVEKDANWLSQIVMLIAGGKNVGTAIFLSLFKKHSTAA